jgi:phage terminase large subunit
MADRHIDFLFGRAFKKLLLPARYKGAWGGRGSGKSHFFATLLVKEHFITSGRRTLCVREVQKSLKESSMETIKTVLARYGLGEAEGFRCYTDRIVTRGDGQVNFVGMQDHTSESRKSMEGYNCAWVEQAEMLSQKSFDILRPTIREPNSELWFSWNPRRRVDPVDVFFRQSNPPPLNAEQVMANWRENRWWNKTLEAERVECLRNQPEQ